MIVGNRTILILLLFFSLLSVSPGIAQERKYTVVDTGQTTSYRSNAGELFGQNAQYAGHAPSCRDNGDGTITDLNTGLMWTQNPGMKKTFREASLGASSCRVGGYVDWRLPTIKELYSLVIFSGIDPNPNSNDLSGLKPFIDTGYFTFEYGDPDKNERTIDAQYISSTKYAGAAASAEEKVFGVNFADGRIKAYGLMLRGTQEKKFYVMYVRGNHDYGKNNFQDNGDGTITDWATGLIWTKDDSKKAMNWQEALRWAEELKVGLYSDWRLPSIKELQTIVDYSRSPDTTGSAAIDPIFSVTEIINEAGKKDFPYFWSSTTHAGLNGSDRAAYIAFGRGLGWVYNISTDIRRLVDVHGAGAQRSDPKTGNPLHYKYGIGPQGDVVRINNYARAVRAGDVKTASGYQEAEEQKIRKKNSRLEGGFRKKLPGLP